ncbi:MAG: gamma-glutamyltransferase [Chthoniobacteraceae bacterium]
MTRRLLSAILLVMSAAMSPAGAATAERGMVATVHPLATHAGVEAMRRGGNAIDAAVAAALTLGVVDGHNSGIGGGCFMLIRLADGRFVAIDGRETAPKAATHDMYIRDGKADTSLSQTGALAVATPGALAAYEHAIRNFGKRPLGEHLNAAAEIAERGFAIDAVYARKLAGAAKALARFPASRAAFLKADGTPHAEGDRLRLPDLARSYRAIAGDGIRWFYEGPFAKAAGSWMKNNGGILTAQDFRDYGIELREPIFTAYRDHRIVSFPPPSSGGVHVAQLLNIVATRDVKAMGAGSADFVHFTAEAMKLAFADRAFWLGDPAFTKVPRGLVSTGYAEKLAAKIRMDRASVVEGHGTPERAYDEIFGRHTTHFSTADAEGNWVACTATINTGFGSKVVVPGTGIVLNNEMDDFSAQPGVANHFGLIGAEANAVAPGKRPLSSMSPTIVLKGDEPVLAIGAAGGPTIISQTVLAIVNVLDFGMDLPAAIAAPRFHHQWSPDELKIEERIGAPVLAELKARGQKISAGGPFGACNAVGRSADGKGFTGASDPRVPGLADGW